jgi:hypothetical protein
MRLKFIACLAALLRSIGEAPSDRRLVHGPCAVGVGGVGPVLSAFEGPSEFYGARGHVGRSTRVGESHRCDYLVENRLLP